MRHLRKVSPLERRRGEQESATLVTRLPDISVIVPARDEERLLPRALWSLRRQTFRDFEVIVVDDGSRDRTPDLVSQIARDDPRFRCVKNDGRGFVAAENTGLQQARGELIARLDADDWSRPRRLELQLCELEHNPAAAAIGTYGWRVNERGVPVARLRTGPAGRAGYAQLMRSRECVRLTHSSVMFRKAAVQRVGGYRADYHPADDFKLWNDLMEEGEVYALPRYLTYYTLRMASISEQRGEAMSLQVARVRRERRLRLPGDVDDVGATQRDIEAAMREQHRRRLTRALANGHIGAARLILRENDIEPRLVRTLLKQALRGH